MPSFKLFAANATPELSKKIAEHLDIPLGKATIDRFSDGEIQVEINENVRGQDVFIVQSTCAPVNDNLMELMILADALRRASSARITAVIPYFGYARQDRRVRSARVPITAKVVADMLDIVNVERVVTVDLHADQIQGFLGCPVDNLYATPSMLQKHNPKEYKNLTVVSPDVGGVVRARAVAKQLNAEIAIVDKRRPKPNMAEAMSVIGDVQDCDCIIVDDMIDTAGTLCMAGDILKKEGARSVQAYCTHPVLSGPAVGRINDSSLDKVVVTDTIPLSAEAQKSPKIKVESISSIIAETMQRIVKGQSVSALFKT